MLIYAHSTPEKLEAVATSKDYIRQFTDLCDLVDAPDIGIDVEFAINYKKALTGDPKYIESFIDSIILSGYALDAHTLQHYVTRVQNNPLLAPYIKNSVDKSSNYSSKDCLTSGCNYFAAISPNIGTIADVGSTLNYTTIPAVSGLSAIPAAFSMSLATLNKIPKSIQESAGELTQLTTNTFKTIAHLFNDPEKVKDQEDAVKEGKSYRSTSISDIYTSDYGTYLNVSTFAPDLLGSIASSMGNCFKLYQLKNRYNPFDYEMNQSGSNKNGITRKIGDTYASTGYNGTNLSNEGDLLKSSNDYTTSVDGGIEATPIRGDLVGNVKKMAVTIFGGYYDEASKTLYTTSWTDVGPSKEYTDAGKTASQYLTTPASERILVDKLKNGWRAVKSPLPRTQGKFNMGFAIGKLSVIEYFKAVGNVDIDTATRAWSKCELEANVKLNGKTYRIGQIDKGPNFEYSRGGSSTLYRVIDITIDAATLLFGIDVKGKKQYQGSVDAEYVKTVVNATHGGSNTVQKGLAEVQLIIPGVYEPGGISSTTRLVGSTKTTEGTATAESLGLELPEVNIGDLSPESVSDGVLPSLDSGADKALEAVEIKLE
jgi:hypothetical protein